MFTIRSCKLSRESGYMCIQYSLFFLILFLFSPHPSLFLLHSLSCFSFLVILLIVAQIVTQFTSVEVTKLLYMAHPCFTSFLLTPYPVPLDPALMQEVQPLVPFYSPFIILLVLCLTHVRDTTLYLSLHVWFVSLSVLFSITSRPFG